MNKTTTSPSDTKRVNSRFNLPFAKDEMVSYYLLLGFAVITLGFIAIVGSQTSSVDDPSVPQIPSFLPYWGEVTATIDWCEPNYTVSPYIAEFVNTITNIGFVVLGLFGIYMHPNLELRFYLTYISIIFVGFGSAAFHATLKWYAQLGDEVPMFFVTLCFFYLTVENDYYPQKYPKLPLILITSLTIFVWFYAVYRFAEIFQLTWGVLTAFVIYRMLLMTRKMSPGERLCYRITTLVLLVSAALWAIEQALCKSVPFLYKFQLHGLFWHLGTAFAAYSATTGCVYARLSQTLHQKDTFFAYKFGFLPIVRYNPFSNKYTVLNH